MKKRYVYILFVLLAVLGALLWIFLAPDPVQEGRCRLVRKKADPDNRLVRIGYQFVRPLESKPDNVKDAPTGFEQPRYFRVKSGTESILMAADYSQKNVRLCIDRDSDGAFSEERCLTAKISKNSPVSRKHQQFGPISLTSGGSDTDVYINCWRNDGRGLLVPFARYFRTGTLLLNGQIYKVAVVDGDYDGLFNTTISLPWEGDLSRFGCDVFAIDLNHDGTFDTSLYNQSEIMPLSQMVRIKDTYYAIDITLDGKALALSETKPEFGMLSVDVNGMNVELGLCSDTAHQHLRGHQWELPVGTYQATHLILAKSDGSGDIWLSTSLFPLASTADLDSLTSFAIKPNQTTSLKIGPPFIVKAEVQVINREEVLIRPFVMGCAGEMYSADIARYRHSPDRKLKIMAEDGTVLVDDSFKYS